LKYKYINREISWLAFNERVLQEAQDKSVPLLERFKFLGIFSNNLDEFFKVRVAAVTRMINLKFKEDIYGDNPKDILNEIDNLVKARKNLFEKCFDYLINELKKENIILVNEKKLDVTQQQFLRNYFHENIRNNIFPILLNNVQEMPSLNDQSIYLAVTLNNEKNAKYALIEIPSGEIQRFVILPSNNNVIPFIFIEDIIRFNLKYIFHQFQFTNAEAYTIKLTRDAELDIDNDVSQGFLQRLENSLKERKKGDYVRFIYDEKMPLHLLQFLHKKLKLKNSTAKIPGSRYHNLKDLQQIPDFNRKDLKYEKQKPIIHKGFNSKIGILKSIEKQDLLLMMPYHSFSHFIDFLYEASLEPKVSHIYITAYRLAKNSKVVAALINAVRNGKKVSILIEPQARFDEAQNIAWAQYLHDEGINVILGVKGLKVHAKVCLVEFIENKKTKFYSYIGTGNFNERTAEIYSDFSLFTFSQDIGNDIKNLFHFFKRNYEIPKFKQLIVAPFSIRQTITKHIKKEIEIAKKGKKALIYMKINSLVDKKMAELLLEAGKAGVQVRLNIRGMSSVATDINHKNIEVISIIDKYLEHGRMFHFQNDDSPITYIGSADIMTRNLDYRVEVLTPILDKKLEKQILEIWQLQWHDNVKARWQSGGLFNQYVSNNSNKKLRAQDAIYTYWNTKN
jgi:polyphosphate kinase